MRLKNLKLKSLKNLKNCSLKNWNRSTRYLSLLLLNKKESNKKSNNQFKMLIVSILTLCFASLMTVGCQPNTTDQILDSRESQVKLRSFQSRAFDTADKTKTMRTAISTLQDLGFVLEKADETLGSVTGTKYVDNQALRMTVMVRPKGANQLTVRANAQYQAKAIEDPLPYQDFFNSLSKAMFLTAHEVD